jgi:hypothetical protein
MKKLLTIVWLAYVCLIGFTSTAWAVKPTEAVLFHCGCEASDEGTAEATSDLVWHEIIVSSNSNGHRKHMVNDEENCTYVDELSVTTDNYLFRDSNDKQDQANSPPLNGVDACEVGVSCPVDGTSCSQAL